MRAVAILLVVIVIALLNAVLLLGAAGHDLGAPPGLFGVLVLALDVSLCTSSLLLGVVFARRRQSLLSVLFLANLAVFIVAAILRMSGFTFPPGALFAIDLYWLHLYLIVLTRYLRLIVGPAA